MKKQLNELSRQQKLRIGAVTDYEKIGSLAQNEQIVVNGYVDTANGKWYQLQNDDGSIKGFVSASYVGTYKVEIKKPTPKKTTTSNNSASSSSNNSNSSSGGSSSNSGSSNSSSSSSTPTESVSSDDGATVPAGATGDGSGSSRGNRSYSDGSGDGSSAGLGNLQ